MDVLLRLRVLIWLLILGLWGAMVYQYLGEEEAEKAQMASIENPFKGMPAPTERLPPTPEPPQPQPRTSESAAAASAPSAPPPVAANPGPGASSLEYVRPAEPERGAAPPAVAPVAAAPRPRPIRPRLRRERALRQADPPIPAGFIKTVTRHFNIYAEGDPASAQFVGLLENLHGNLMLDLVSFSPWASEERVTVYLFKNQDTYRNVTGRPPWSGGASSVPNRKVYVYESEELPGILAHELCHIYYDGFFLAGQADPLWLSEGMATLVQVERGMAAPNWLKENLDILERGGGFSMTEMMSVTSTSDSPDEKVRLWYAQAYSTVRFLIRAQSKNNFYRFSQHLREGRDTTQALYRAYGMPYNRLKALEYAWRYELASNSLSRLSSDPTLSR